MSYHTPVPSSDGTPISDRTVGEIVAKNPSLSRVFQLYQLDFCCQGATTLRQACEKKSLSLAEVCVALAEEAESNTEAGNNLAELLANELADYIVETHHGYLRQELPRVHIMAERVAQVHGPRNNSLIELYSVFSGMFIELDSHMRKEEEVLFPTIKSLFADSSSDAVFEGDLERPVEQLIDEHDDTERTLKHLRKLTNDFQPPAEACNTYRALFSGLKDLAEDLQRHVHLENSALFPMAIKRYAELNG